jgi:Bacterial regulatory helix-turn-helix protein, lysR family
MLWLCSSCIRVAVLSCCFYLLLFFAQKRRNRSIQRQFEPSPQPNRSMRRVAIQRIGTTMECKVSALRMDSLRLIWLQAFLKLVECESQSMAGEQLGCDQSTISRYISRLEAWLGNELFKQLVPPVLSPHGKAFLPVAREVLQLLTDSRTQTAIMRKPPLTPAQARERERWLVRFLRRFKPKPGTPQQKYSKLSNDFWQQVDEAQIELVRESAQGTVSGADIDMSWYSPTDTKG